MQKWAFFLSSYWPTKGHKGGLPGFPTQLDIFHTWCQGLFRLQISSNHSLHCPIANTLNQHRATTNIGQLIESSRLWWLAAAPRQHLNGQPPIQVLTELNTAWLQWSNKNLYFQVNMPLRHTNVLQAACHAMKTFLLLFRNFFWDCQFSNFCPVLSACFLLPYSTQLQ